LLIKKIAQQTLQEIEKSQKDPYPLYYTEIFNLIAKENNITLNPKLSMQSHIDLGENFLTKTKTTFEFIEKNNSLIKNDSQNLVEEFEEKNVNEEILELVKNFEAGLMDIIQKSNKKIEELNRELNEVYKQLHIDSLTKVYNRKALEDDLDKLTNIGKSKTLNSVLFVFDFDYFKNINDNYGHLVGDFVLKKIVSIIKEIIRDEDKIYRFGGDEFVIIFNRIDKTFISKIAEKIRKTIETKKLKYKDDILVVTLSIGIACHKLGDTKEEWLHRGDKALYESKKTRNKVTIKC